MELRPQLIKKPPQTNKQNIKRIKQVSCVQNRLYIHADRNGDRVSGKLGIEGI